MIGLVLKDIYCMKQFLRTYLGMMAFFFVFAFFMKSPEYLVFMAMIMGTSMIFSIFGIDEAGGYSYSMCLPVDRRKIVTGRYLLMLLGMMVLLILTLIGGGIIAVIIEYESMGAWVGVVIGAAAFYLLIMALVVPVAFKWKADKARIVLMGAVALPALLILIVDKTGIDIDAFLEQADGLWGLTLGFLIFSLVCYMISYFVSIHLFEKKEF